MSLIILIKMEGKDINLLNKTFKDKNDSQWEQIKLTYWNPDVGDKIEGKLVEIKEINNHKLYLIEANDKNRIKIWGKSYLDQLMEDVNINDYIRITFTGFKKTQNNRQMKRYNVERRINNDKS